MFILSAIDMALVFGFFCGRVPWLYQHWLGRFMGFMVLWFYVQEHPKAQQAVALVLKRLRRRSHGLKSHPTDWEKLGIDPTTPDLQDVGLSPTLRQVLVFFFLKIAAKVVVMFSAIPS